LEEDIPILLVSGYSSGGSGSVEEDVEYFRDKGRWRAPPLMPPNEPLALSGRLWDKLTKSYRNPSESLRNVDKAIQDQLLRLTYSIYRKKGLRYRGDGAEFFGYRDKDFKWERAITDVARLMPRWNAAKFSYTFPDGSMLPAPPRYAKAIWKPTAFGLEPMLTIERQDRAKVNIL